MPLDHCRNALNKTIAPEPQTSALRLRFPQADRPDMPRHRMTTPSRDTVVLREDDLLEGAPIWMAARKGPTWPVVWVARDLKRDENRLTGETRQLAAAGLACAIVLTSFPGETPVRLGPRDPYMLKVWQRNSSADARNDEARSAHLKRFLRFLHIARAIFEPGKFF